jgi:hypothetical protein
MICKNHYIHREHHKQMNFMSDRKLILKIVKKFVVIAICVLC